MTIYQDDSFDSFEAKFLIQKAYKSLNIELIESTEEPVCNAGNLILTYNKTLEGECTQFETTKDTAYYDAENLVYFMIQ